MKYHPQLSRPSYLQLLSEKLPQLLEDIPLATWQTIWALHDGVPVRSSRDAMRYLDSHYPGRWTGRNGPFVWPERSAEIIPAPTSTCEAIQRASLRPTM
jgi:hypothetical protein